MTLYQPKSQTDLEEKVICIFNLTDCQIVEKSYCCVLLYVFMVFVVLPMNHNKVPLSRQVLIKSSKTKGQIHDF